MHKPAAVREPGDSGEAVAEVVQRRARMLTWNGRIAVASAG
jgi:hypothetical protein